MYQTGKAEPAPDVGHMNKLLFNIFPLVLPLSTKFKSYHRTLSGTTCKIGFSISLISLISIKLDDNIYSVSLQPPETFSWRPSSWSESTQTSELRGSVNIWILSFAWVKKNLNHC